MQGKVSIVMTCYNKADYIGDMFDSIIAQTWDSIELILVNDGSTDGTRDVIAAYEPKFTERGYSVVVIDQENSGVCAAAKAGLERITGSYLCVIDADDKLAAQYVSLMAGWLERHKEYDYCTCGCKYITEAGDDKKDSPPWVPGIKRERPLVEDNLLVNIRQATWAYMVRADYFYKCRIIETYITDTRGSHEPSFMIPVTAYGGKAKIFYKALYVRRLGVEGAHSFHDAYKDMERHYTEYYSITRKAISLLPDEIASTARKRQLLRITDYVELRSKYAWANRCREKETASALFDQIRGFANAYFKASPEITPNQTLYFEQGFIQAVNNAIIKKRIIGYGALGRVAARCLPLLVGTPLEPTELWDINSDGKTIKKPEFDTLDGQDTVLVFPKGSIEKEMRRKLRKAPCKVLYYNDIHDYLAGYLFSGKLK